MGAHSEDSPRVMAVDCGIRFRWTCEAADCPVQGRTETDVEALAAAARKHVAEYRGHRVIATERRTWRWATR